MSRRTRRTALAALATGLVVVAGGSAVAADRPRLSTEGPTSVTGTEGTAVFTLGEHTVRQVRYADRGTLRYTFRIRNDGRLPVRVEGLSDRQPPSRLFAYRSLRAEDGATIAPGGSETFTLALRMGGCETLSARAGSFVTDVVVATTQAGVFSDEVRVTLPEELHTGSPREAFCPDATATSRPPG